MLNQVMALTLLHHHPHTIRDHQQEFTLLHITIHLVIHHLQLTKNYTQNMQMEQLVQAVVEAEKLIIMQMAQLQQTHNQVLHLVRLILHITQQEQHQHQLQLIISNCHQKEAQLKK